MSPPKPEAGVDVVELVNSVIAETVRACGGADHGAYYKEVARIIIIFELYLYAKEAP